MISTSRLIQDSFEVKNLNSTKDFSLNVQSLSLDSEYYAPNHRQVRCGCFACRNGQLPINENSLLPPKDNKPLEFDNSDLETSSSDDGLSLTPSNTSFYLKTPAEVAALTLDSLAALDSPYIAGTFTGSKWGTIDPDLGATTELTYYITPANEVLTYGMTSVASTSAEHSAITIAMATYTDVANLVFTETSTGDSNANFRWAFSSNDEARRVGVIDDDQSLLGIADFPGSEGNVTSDVITFSDQYAGNSGAIDAGGYYYATLPHELGHALGLAHPHNGPETYAFYEGKFYSELYPGVPDGGEEIGGENYLNSTPYSLMSYNDKSSQLTIQNSQGVETRVTPGGKVNYGYAEGLGAFDIATIQYLYGPNTSQATGDDVYLLDTSTLNGYRTIWDNGGSDTISATNSGAGVVIDLRSATLLNEDGGGGYLSRVDDQFIGYSIAYNTTGTAIIENAIGSSSADRINGNSDNNSLDGGSGNDIITSGAGDDTLLGNAGNDYLDGGVGSDTALFSGTLSDYNVSFTFSGLQLIDQRPGSPDGTDTLTNIQFVDFNGMTLSWAFLMRQFGPSPAPSPPPEPAPTPTPIPESFQTVDGFTQFTDADDTLIGQANIKFRMMGGNDLLEVTGGIDNFANGNRGEDKIILLGGQGRYLGGSDNDIFEVFAADEGTLVNGNRGEDTITGAVSGVIYRGGKDNDTLALSQGEVWGDLGVDLFRGVTGDGYAVIQDYTIGEDFVDLPMNGVWSNFGDGLMFTDDSGDQLMLLLGVSDVEHVTMV